MKLVFKNYTLLSEDEAKGILDLRNKEFIREQMRYTKIIDIEDHLHFIASLKGAKSSKYFAVFVENELVGSLNYIRDGSLEWGLYFNDSVSVLIKSLSCYIFLEYLFNKFDDVVSSSVKRSNKNALRFNENFGFCEFDRDGEFVHLNLSKSMWQERKASKLLRPIMGYAKKFKYEIVE